MSRLVLFMFVCSVCVAGPRGGSMMDFHTRSISAFDESIEGNPRLFGGIVENRVSSRFSFGATYMMSPKIGAPSTSMALNYGGLIGRFFLFENFTFNLIVGGGSYRVERREHDLGQIQVFAKIAQGAYFLAYPSVSYRIKLFEYLTISLNTGCFLPEISALRGLNFGLNLFFG